MVKACTGLSSAPFTAIGGAVTSAMRKRLEGDASAAVRRENMESKHGVTSVAGGGGGEDQVTAAYQCW